MHYILLLCAVTLTSKMSDKISIWSIMRVAIAIVFAKKVVTIQAKYLAPTPQPLAPLVVNLTLTLQDILELLTRCDVAAEAEAKAEKEEAIAKEEEMRGLVAAEGW